jgi:very-short-patch-repair endonuclease
MRKATVLTLLFPKPKKRIKIRKPLKRSKKRPAARAKFREFGANCTKAYRRRYSDYEVTCQAEVCRQRRLENATPAEEAFGAILTRLGVKYEREKVILNGDRWVLIDFFIPSVNLAVELDGAQHLAQKEYDHGRSMWLARKGIKVCRFWNKAVMDGTAEQRIREALRLNNI